MLSMIVSVSDQCIFREKAEFSFRMLENFCNDNNLEQPQLIEIIGNESIFKNYNDGIKQSKFPIKVFVHQDVELLSIHWIFDLLVCFAEHPECALIGMVGTDKLDDNSFWWSSGVDHIYGSVISGEEKADWKWKKINKSQEVECIDGFFIATNRDIKFDEEIGKSCPWHLYDLDISRQIRQQNLKIRVIDYAAWHIGKIRNDVPNFEVYNKKWEKT